MENRIVKFRLWDGIDYMSNPFTLQDVQSGKIQFTSDATVLQFVKVVYQFGKPSDLYEGDLVAFETEDGYSVAEIKFVDFDRETSSEINGFIEDVIYSSDEELLDGLGEPCGFMIIGNIYEKSEFKNKYYTITT